MTNRYEDEAARLVEDLLSENPNPRTSDWKHLIDAHPQLAGAIADAALAHSGTDEAAEGGNPLPFNDALFNATIS